MSKPNLRLIPGGQGTAARGFASASAKGQRAIYVPPPRTRLPLWRWLSLTGQLLAIGLGSFVVTVVLSMVLSLAVPH